MLFYYFFSDFV